MLRCGVIGTGALGRHHVRILAQMPGVELVGIHDRRRDVAQALATEHGTEQQPIRVCESVQDLAREVDAVVLAVPTVDHTNLGVPLLEQGLHLLVEKPMAASLDEADALLAACRPQQVLAVGHVEFYNPAVQALLGSRDGTRFVEVQRLSPFSPRSLDVDVILDLMIHDLHILHALDPSPIREIRAAGVSVLSDRVDLANARLELASGLVANLTASRVSAEPVRKLRVFQRSSYYSVDYRDQELKAVRLVEGAEGGREIQRQAPDVTKAEPLRAELDAFVAACRGESQPYVDGEQGRRALATAIEVGLAVRRHQHAGS